METAKVQDVAITVIGQVEKGEGVGVLDAENTPLRLEKAGYVHE